MHNKKTITLSGTEVGYDIVRSSRRTLSLSVREGGSLLIRAPWHLSAGTIMSFVISKEPWIIRQRNRVLEKEAAKKELNYSEGCLIPYMGNEYKIELSEAKRKSIIVNDSAIYVASRYPTDPEKVKEEMDSWYLAEAKEHLISRTFELAVLYGSETGIPSSVGVRKMKSRWGTCRTNGKIMLNSELIKKRQDLIDSVILHELCHLKHH
ncbi:MAG TPA: SprT family zinc-dependent metalloprotease, partial [Bacteroidales bacterium]|nr:SprT family zinc-dependent metalloprotease [Bacteroidales bacterium]